MKIMGIDGLGNILKKILSICFYIGICILIILPFILQRFGLRLTSSLFIIYPNGIVMLVIMKMFIELFDSLKKNQPFCDKNVRILKTAGKASLVEAILWIIDLIFGFVVIRNIEITYILVVSFLVLLFFGVFIALYILSELFKDAVHYKKENELTI